MKLSVASGIVNPGNIPTVILYLQVIIERMASPLLLTPFTFIEIMVKSRQELWLSYPISCADNS
jgi:hypothetical protein